MVFHLRQPDALHRFLIYIYQETCQPPQKQYMLLILFNKLIFSGRTSLYKLPSIPVIMPLWQNGFCHTDTSDA